MKISNYFRGQLLSVLEKKPSSIHGNGLFADMNFRHGDILFVAADMRNPFNKICFPAQLVNHSKKKANIAIVKFKDFPRYYFAITRRAIFAGEELLGNYTIAPDFFLSQKDKIMLAELEK